MCVGSDISLLIADFRAVCGESRFPARPSNAAYAKARPGRVRFGLKGAFRPTVAAGRLQSLVE